MSTSEASGCQGFTVRMIFPQSRHAVRGSVLGYAHCLGKIRSVSLAYEEVQQSSCQVNT